MDETNATTVVQLPTLDVGTYDAFRDEIVIEGIRYAGQIFREFGLRTTVGQVLRIESKSPETRTLTVRVVRGVVELLEARASLASAKALSCTCRSFDLQHNSGCECTRGTAVKSAEERLRAAVEAL